MVREIISILLILGIVWGQDYESEPDNYKERNRNVEKKSMLDGISSFEENPIILKKNDDELLIRPWEKIKVITTDGNVVIGRYSKISVLKKEILVTGIMNSKFWPLDDYTIPYNNNNINEISIGSGNKTIQYGLGYAACIGITSYIWYKIILIKHKRGESVNFSIPYYLGFFGTPLFGWIGITDGVMISTKFEDPILVNNIEWEIVN